jgi:hypothetical protein
LQGLREQHEQLQPAQHRCDRHTMRRTATGAYSTSQFSPLGSFATRPQLRLSYTTRWLSKHATQSFTGATVYSDSNT